MPATEAPKRPGQARSEFNRNRRHIDHYRVLGETLSALEGLAIGLRLIDLDAIPEGERVEWSDQLREALRPLRRFTQEMAATSRGESVVCARCAESFVPIRSDARYCSVRCRVAAHRAKELTP